jgi:hypothetical protein
MYADPLTETVLRMLETRDQMREGYEIVRRLHPECVDINAAALLLKLLRGQLAAVELALMPVDDALAARDAEKAAG